MRRFALIAFLMIALVARAEAASCPSPTISAGWGQTFYGTSVVAGFLWDSNINVLYVMNTKVQYWTFINVGRATAQNFANTQYVGGPGPDTFFAQNIVGAFPEALEAENCQPLLNENGNYLLDQ